MAKAKTEKTEQTTEIAVVAKQLACITNEEDNMRLNGALAGVSDIEEIPPGMAELMDGATGTEGVESGDAAIPFLRVLQALSPAVDRNDSKYIDGAQAGHMINTATNETFNHDFEEGIIVVPVGFKKVFVEFRQRNDNGGGFVAQYDRAEGLKQLETCTKDEKNKPRLPNGNQLVESNQHFVLVVDEKNGGMFPAVVNMESSNLRVSKQWNALIDSKRLNHGGRAVKPPSFFYFYKLTTVAAKNDQGSWHMWNVEDVGPNQHLESLQNGRVICDDVANNAVKVQSYDEAEGPTDAEYTQTPPNSAPMDDDGPF